MTVEMPAESHERAFQAGREGLRTSDRRLHKALNRLGLPLRAPDPVQFMQEASDEEH